MLQQGVDCAMLFGCHAWQCRSVERMASQEEQSPATFVQCGINASVRISCALSNAHFGPTPVDSYRQDDMCHDSLLCVMSRYLCSV